MQNAARTYFQTKVATTTQGDLLIMLFDGALQFLAQARERIEAKDYAQKGILISNALDILTELQATLNPEKGGKLAERLKMLYLYCSTRLLRANRRMDLDSLDETVRILTGLRAAFAEANSRVTTRCVEMPSNHTLAPGAMAATTPAPHTSGNLGAAAYAKAARPSPRFPGNLPPTAVEPAPAAESGGDVPSLADALDRLAAEPADLPAEASAGSTLQPGEAARSLTPVRRAMAAYSSGGGR